MPTKGNCVEIGSIIKALDAEIEQLQQARKLLAANDGLSKAGARTKKSSQRRLSPEARARISEAQRKRWAKAKRSS